MPATPHRRGAGPLLLSLHADGRIASHAALDRLAELIHHVTDCFVFCHGWLYDAAEARVEAARFFGLLDVALQPLGDRVVPLRVAIHWPSKPLGATELTRLSSGAGLWPELARCLARGAAFSADTPLSEIGKECDRQTSLDRLLIDLCAAEIPLAPEEERELDHVLHGLRDTRGDALAWPFHALGFWVMKRRAGQVGERLAREYLAPLTDGIGPPRIHLVGHSFGAKLLTSTVLGGVRPRSLTLLQGAFSAFAFAGDIPGAARPGYYHPVLADGQIGGPIVVLRSIHDRALSLLYAAATGSGEIDRARTSGGRLGHIPATVARSALGAVGARGVGAPEVELLEATRIGLPRYRIVNVDGSHVVRADHWLLGAHRDIDHPEIATLVLLAAGLVEGSGDGVRAPRLSPAATV